MGSTRVSTLENLVKPIADPAAGPFVRTSINGYFLDFSNLSTDIKFEVLAIISKYTPPGAPGESFEDREFTTTAPGPQQDPSGTGNHNVIYDIAGGTQFGQNAVGEFRYLGETPCVKIYQSDTFKLCRGGTAQLAVLPFLGPGPNLLQDQQYEVRGYLSLGIVSTGSFTSRIRMLLQPQQRGTFLPVNGTTDPAEVSQLFSSMASAAGQSEVQIPTANAAPTAAVSSWLLANGITVGQVQAFIDQLNLVI